MSIGAQCTLKMGSVLREEWVSLCIIYYAHGSYCRRQILMKSFWSQKPRLYKLKYIPLLGSWSLTCVHAWIALCVYTHGCSNDFSEMYAWSSLAHAHPHKFLHSPSNPLVIMCTDIFSTPYNSSCITKLKLLAH